MWTLSKFITMQSLKDLTLLVFEKRPLIKLFSNEEIIISFESVQKFFKRGTFMIYLTDFTIIQSFNSNWMKIC